jgi:hypothetical protein
MQRSFQLDRLPADLVAASLNLQRSDAAAIETLSGESLSRTALIQSLPPPNTKRWVVRRKAAVIAAVRSGGITIEEACRVYQLSEEEFLSWQRAFEIHGLAGLRATRVQQYRESRPARAPSASLEQPVEPSLSSRAAPSTAS